MSAQFPEDLKEVLTSFVPALVARRIAYDPAPISEPSAERISTAVFFADITGFTAVAERFTRQGLAGSEELANILNEFFGQLIEIIQENGGEVTKFAGDALLALWPVPADIVRLSQAAEDSLAEMVRKAAQCALAVQDAIQGYAAAEDLDLSLEIGIGAGDVYSVHLGGVFDRWEFLLSGSPLIQMSLAKELAQPGQVVLSPEAWNLVMGGCLGQHQGQRFMRLLSVSEPLPVKPAELPTLAPEANNNLQAYIPAAVFSRLEPDMDGWLSEWRHITVLFIKLPGYGASITHPYERTLPEAQSVMRTLQSALYRYAGSINKLNVDDKGITLVAALGLPPLSHGDDAARAIHAALEMQEALEKLGRTCAIGITTGWIFCGPVGNRRRREYTMVGNEVNMATRLMQAAEVRMNTLRKMSYLLCDESTRKAIQHQAEGGQALAERIEFETLSPIKVKGKVDPVTVYHPTLRARSPYPVQRRRLSKVKMIGREAERKELNRYLEALANPSRDVNASGSTRLMGKVILVEGEAGFGKSILPKDALEKAATQGMRSLIGAGHEQKQTTPFYAWQSIFRQLFEIDDSVGGVNAQRSHVMARLPLLRGERGYPALSLRLSPLLNPVMPLGFPENRLTASMTDDLRYKTTLLFLLRLIEWNFAGGGGKTNPPRIIALDNAQWLDDASWELALSVSRKVRPLLMIVAGRPLQTRNAVRQVSKAQRRLIQARNAAKLILPALTTHETSEFLGDIFQVESVPWELAVLLEQKTGGHPQYIEELVLNWKELGLLEVSNQSLSPVTTLSALNRMPLPETVQHAAAGRLDRLPPLELMLLKVASVIGRSFSLAALQNILPNDMDRERLLGHIEVLEMAGLIQSVEEGPEPTYRFRSTVIQEMATKMLPFSRRRQLQEALKAAS